MSKSISHINTEIQEGISTFTNIDATFKEIVQCIAGITNQTQYTTNEVSNVSEALAEINNSTLLITQSTEEILNSMKDF